jgi:predicted ATPase
MNLKKPIRRPDVMVKDIGGETLLYSRDEKAIHVLNPTAQRIWELCDGQHTVADIAQAIRSSFVVPDQHDLTADIRQVIAVFVEKGLLLITDRKA